MQKSRKNKKWTYIISELRFQKENVRILHESFNLNMNDSSFNVTDKQIIIGTLKSLSSDEYKLCYSGGFIFTTAISHNNRMSFYIHFIAKLLFLGFVFLEQTYDANVWKNNDPETIASLDEILVQAEKKQVTRIHCACLL